MPCDIPGVHADRDEFSPGWRITRILRFGIPEPAALRRDFAIRCCIRVIRTAVAATTTIATTAARAAPTRLVGIEFFDMAPLAGVHHVREDHAEPRVEGDAVPVSSSDCARK